MIAEYSKEWRSEDALRRIKETNRNVGHSYFVTKKIEEEKLRY